MSSDDLLPILIYLVVKCDINHWLANINYLKYFNFTKSPQDKLGSVAVLVSQHGMAIKVHSVVQMRIRLPFKLQFRH